MTVHGFDVSNNNAATPDFTQGGRVFGFCKASEGTHFTDPNFAANRQAMHAQGLIVVGFYHFAVPANDPIADAEHFLGVVGKPAANEVAVLDYETGHWNPAWIDAWVGHVKAAGWRTGVYTMSSMWSPVQADFYWIAQYGTTPPKQPWTFWQHTDGHTASDGPYDCSVFNGTADDLRAWVGASPSGGFLMALSDQEQQELLVKTRDNNDMLKLVVSRFQADDPMWGQTHDAVARIEAEQGNVVAPDVEAIKKHDGA